MKTPTLAVLAGLILASCSNQVVNSSRNTSSSANDVLSDSTLSTIEMQDADHLRKQVEQIIGRDSSGIAAMDYISDYEDGLNKILSQNAGIDVGIDKVDPRESNPVPPICGLYDTEEMRIRDRNTAVDQLSSYRQQTFLKSLELYNHAAADAAESKMKENYDLFIQVSDASRGMNYAKSGLAAGYILLITDPVKNTSSILKKMQLMYAGLRH